MAQDDGSTYRDESTARPYKEYRWEWTTEGLPYTRAFDFGKAFDEEIERLGLSKGEKMKLWKVYATDGEEVKEVFIITKSQENAVIKAAMKLEIDPDEWDIFPQEIGKLSEDK